MKNKIMTALLSLVIAFGIWMYVVSVVAPESERTYADVPIRIHGSNLLESRGLMLLSEQNMTVDLELSGTRTDLNKLSSANITVIADLSHITAPGEYVVHYSVSYPGDISSSMTILSPASQTVTVQVVEWAQKEVPIKVAYAGQLAQGFEADKNNVTLDRETVIVSGPKTVIDTIHYAEVVVELDEQTSNIDKTLDLVFKTEDGKSVTSEHITADADHATVVLKINMVKTIQIKVKIMPGGGLTEEDAQYELANDSLVVSGPAAVLEELTEIVIPIYIGELSESGKYTYAIRLPEGVSNESGMTQVDVQITLPKATSKTVDMTITQGMFQNLPEGLQFEILQPQSQSLPILLKGREHRLDPVTAENLRLSIDLSNATEGEKTYQVTVQIVDAEGVEVASIYYVTLNITADTEA